MTSYYFAIHKKLRAIGKSGHTGVAMPGSFTLDDPARLFGASAKGAFLGTTRNNSPAWAILNQKAVGGGQTVVVGGVIWRTMPLTTPTAWTDFQDNAVPPSTSIVETLGVWIEAGKVNDTPATVLTSMPPNSLLATKTDAATTVFSVSSVNDDGDRPGSVPMNFWDTAQIFLTDPQTGATVTPSQFAQGSSYNLVGVIGNRGPVGGRFAAPSNTVQAKALVMVFGTGITPAVELPALSNMDPASLDSIYEVYDMPAKAYELVGFRFNTQDVFDGLVKAIEANGMDLGGVPADIWLNGQSSVGHVCAKLVVRLDSQTWPLSSDTPFTNNRVSQKNLVPFAVDVIASDPNNPPIIWRNIMVGQAFRAIRGSRHPGAKHNIFRFVGEFPEDAVELFLAIPTTSMKTYFDPERMRGVEITDLTASLKQKPPMPDCVVLSLKSGKDVLIEIPDLKDQFIAMSIGVRVDPQKVKLGQKFNLTLLHSSLLPETGAKSKHRELTERFAPGLTFEISLTDGKSFTE